MKELLLFAFLATGSYAMYSRSDDVVILDPGNFNEKVIQSKDLWIVEFYAPWCGHCQSLTPEYKKAATALKGVVKIGAVDADEHKSLGGQYGVQGFPTIKVFGENKNSPTDYQGARTAQGIVDSAMSSLRSIVNGRLSGKKSGGGGQSSGGGGGGGQKAGDPDDVIELTDSNFQKEVLESEDMWMVEFFAPWCGHCKNLAPHWASAASQLKGKVRFGALDATVHSVTGNKYGVRGYPTIKMFPAGKKDDAQEYDGGRTSSDIVAWVNDRFVVNLPSPEVFQIKDEALLKENCEGHQLCIIAILPHILDCQSKCRNDYIKLMLKMGDKYKQKGWGWLWAEAGQQPDLEQALGIGGFGYPAMAAVNSRKMMFSLMKGQFSEHGIGEFLRDLSYGRGGTAPLKNAKLPPVETVEPWDGKDGQLEVEEDIDLSDVELDDLDTDKKDEL